MDDEEKCAARGCLSSTKEVYRNFYRFPEDEHRATKWTEALNRPDLRHMTAESLSKTYSVCDLHFEKKYRAGNVLSRNAVPKLGLPNNPPQDKSVQTDINVNKTCKTLTREHACLVEIPPDPATSETKSTLFDYSAEPTPKKKKIDGTMVSPPQLISIEDLKKYILERRPSELRKLINFYKQVKLAKRNKKQWKAFKLSILRMYLASPVAYKVFKNALRLPSASTLQNINIDIDLNLNSTTLCCLEAKFRNMKPKDKCCIICVGTIPLKRHLYYQINKDKIIGFREINDEQIAEPARHVFVVMAKAVYSDWKQPLAYCFLAENKYTTKLKPWINEIITKILNIGLTVVGFVSDHSPIFAALASELNVSAKKPYFSVDGTKIYYIFDSCQLVRCLRNDLLECNFGFLGASETEMTAEWKHVIALYELDCKMRMRLAPQLTTSHIHPSEDEKSEIKYATQVFTEQVAAAMIFFIKSGQIEQNALGTVEFIDLIGKIIAILNSTSVKNTIQYKAETMNKFDFFMKNVSIINKNNGDVTVAAQYFNCWKITIKSMSSLIRDLQAIGFPVLSPRKLNRRVLDQTFNSKELLTSIKFTRTFKKIFLENLLQCSDANCSNILDEFLLTVDDFDTSKFNCETTMINEDNTPIKTVDYRFDLPEEEGLVRLCENLFMKCFNVHKCKQMMWYVQSNNDVTALISCVKAMNDRFKCFFQYIIANPVGNEILKELRDISYMDSCVCFPNKYFKKLFIRFRIYNILRYNNNVFKKDPCLKETFCVNDL